MRGLQAAHVEDRYDRYVPLEVPPPPQIHSDELLAIGRRVYAEVREEHSHARELQAHWAARLQQQIAVLAQQFDPIDPFHVFHDNREAYDKGFKLFQDNLTPVQRSQFEHTKWFDVVGSDSGKTYRIHQGTSMNVGELNKDGEEVNRWCFRPEGNLVLGDILLAQKILLETCEKEVLKIANPARRGGGAPITGPRIVWMLVAAVIGSAVVPLLAPALAVLGIGPLIFMTPMLGAILGAFIAHNA